MPDQPPSPAAGTPQTSSAATDAADVVVCAADENYALPLAVMLESLLANAEPAVPLQVYIIDCGLEPGSRAGIDSLFRAEGRALFRPCWLESRRSARLADPRWGHVSGVTYERLLLDDYLPGHVRSALWLDGDLLVLDAVTPLLRTAHPSAVLHAVRDPFIPRASSPFGIRHWRALGLAADTPYFNAGVMRIDLARWREREVAARALDYLERYRKTVYFNEQEALNAVIGPDWAALDDRWNLAANPMHAANQRPGGGGPAVVHFAGRVKPWEVPGLGEIQARYFHYLDRTPWRSQRPARGLRKRLLGWYLGSGLRRATYGLENLHLRLRHLRGN